MSQKAYVTELRCDVLLSLIMQMLKLKVYL